jgi:hypothetical protein
VREVCGGGAVREVCGGGAVREGNMRKRWLLFKEGRNKVLDKGE